MNQRAMFAAPTTQEDVLDLLQRFQDIPDMLTKQQVRVAARILEETLKDAQRYQMLRERLEPGGVFGETIQFEMPVPADLDGFNTLDEFCDAVMAAPTSTSDDHS